MNENKTAKTPADGEPVAWMGVDSYGNVIKFRTNEFGGGIPLYTAPPKQPEQKPVARVEYNRKGNIAWLYGPVEPDGTLLYTAPPKREWVGLTDKDEEQCCIDADASYRRHMSSIRGQMISPADNYDWHLIKAVLAKAKEKNK